MSAVVKCSRCRRRMRRLDGWNTDFRAGLVVGHICPGCQTPEENAEAEINEATVDYSTWHVGADGRVRGRSPWASIESSGGYA